MIKEAVILAAGMGTRLSDAMAKKPKCFIIFDRHPIIEESIRKLLKHGIERIWIVTGYEPQNFEILTERNTQVISKQFGIRSLRIQAQCTLYTVSGNM